MFERVLIANRGEIAVRVIRACREMSIQPVAVYSDADERAPHALLADRAVRLGPAPPADSYLSIEALLRAAQESGADAVHPGYGFLSEHAPFAAACAAAGLTFIGPPAAAIERMGSKVAARRLAASAGVPVVPGETPQDQGDAALLAAAERVGFPVLIKPAAGGGGIGMKVVIARDGLASAAAQARREARAAFGDETLYVERLVIRPRHVEVQVLGDRGGQCVHLFERECSVQRRHQKVIEETPSTALSPALRQRMGEAAVAVARAAGYFNAGTVEFLLEGSGDAAAFYFLEMNTRLQVEHPVTEAVTGVDLVRAQIALAAGQPLPWRQSDLAQRGHAIEARVYAEDPGQNDLPQAGRVLLYRAPAMPGVRVDAGIWEGSDVPVHYDPLLAKVIAWGESRDVARRRLVAALRAFPILGVRTNVALLTAVLDHPRFVAGDLDTQFLDEERGALTPAGAEPPDAARAVAALLTAPPAAHDGAAPPGSAAVHDPWTTLRGVRV